MFTPHSSFVTWCSPQCGYELSQSKVEKDRKAKWKQEKKAIKEKLMKPQDWLRLLQKIFNTYVRERDKGKPCISCAIKWDKTFHAGHCFTVGSYPNLRFDEDNCHGQCVQCNLHYHGNSAEYILRLPERIGIENYESLLSRKQDTLRLTLPEVKEKIEYYKAQIKTLQHERKQREQLHSDGYGE